MASRAAERLLVLEGQGITFSRNQNFEVFEKIENRSALRLYRRLQRIAEILTSEKHAPVSVQLRTHEDDGLPHHPSHQLCMAFTTIDGTYHAYLFADEYALLWRDEGIARILVGNGLCRP